MKKKVLDKRIVWCFTIFYIIVWTIIHRNIFYLPNFSFKVLFIPLFGSALFYSGLENLRTGKGWIRGAPLSRKAAIMSGWSIILFSLAILIFL